MGLSESVNLERMSPECQRHTPGVVLASSRATPANKSDDDDNNRAPQTLGEKSHSEAQFLRPGGAFDMRAITCYGAKLGISKTQPTILWVVSSVIALNVIEQVFFKRSCAVRSR